jgi:hypothetical protein
MHRSLHSVLAHNNNHNNNQQQQQEQSQQQHQQQQPATTMMMPYGEELQPQVVGTIFSVLIQYFLLNR